MSRNRVECGPTLLALTVALWWSVGASAQTVAVNTVDHIRHRLETAFEFGHIEIGGRRVLALDAIRRFYENRVYAPVWTTGSRVSQTTNGLLQTIANSEVDGLTPEDYHLATIRHLLRVLSRPQSTDARRARLLADLDLLLTDAFLAYGAHLSGGRVNPSTLHTDGATSPVDIDVAEVLERAVDRNTIASSLEALRPPQPEYDHLRHSIKTYQAIASRGGWPHVTEGRSLHAGTNDDRVGLLRDRLTASGDHVAPRASAVNPDHFDYELQRSLMRFQKRHGLEANGTLDSQTVAALNVPAAWRARQLEINLERWRWLPHELGDPHIRVHITSFDMEVRKNGSQVLEIPVVTGRPDRPTPVFSGLMTYLVLNPHWYVPRSIAVEDKLPLIKRDPTYLVRQEYRIFTGWGEDAIELDPLEIDWDSVTPENFSYQLRQEPGARNALGYVKFMFPNEWNVYMHDTPQRELFDVPERPFSSGCIRVQRPIDLTHYLLDGDPRWSADSIASTIAAGLEMTVSLPSPIPIHLVYWTAWVDDRGVVQFRRDIYDRDHALDRALREPLQ